MNTPDLRKLIATAAAECGGRLWPNGLGFDSRGTHYTYSERLERWTASRRLSDAAVKYGEGDTPGAAKRAMGKGR